MSTRADSNHGGRLSVVSGASDWKWSNWKCGLVPKRICLGELLSGGGCEAVAKGMGRGALTRLCVAHDTCTGLYTHTQLQTHECHLLRCTLTEAARARGTSSCIKRYMPRADSADSQAATSLMSAPKKSRSGGRLSVVSGLSDRKSSNWKWSNWTCGLVPKRSCLGELLSGGGCEAVANAMGHGTLLKLCVAHDNCKGFYTNTHPHRCHLLRCTLADTAGGRETSSCLKLYMPRVSRLESRADHEQKVWGAEAAHKLQAPPHTHTNRQGHGQGPSTRADNTLEYQPTKRASMLFVPVRKPTSSLNPLFYVNLDQQPALPRTYAIVSHFLTVAAVIQNEAAYLPEWIEYHSLRGVSHFYLYDDSSTDRHELNAVLAPYLEAQLVTVHNLSSLPNMGSIPSAMEFDHPGGITATKEQLPNAPYKNAKGAMIHAWRPGTCRCVLIIAPVDVC